MTARPRPTALLAVALLAAPIAAKEPTFAELVETKFAAWDRNRDGKLSAEEVNALVKNPAVAGPEAAAVAAVHAFLRAPKAPPAVTKAELLHPTASGGEGRRDQNGGVAHFASRYQEFVRHLSNAPRALFAEPTAPRLEGMSQGHVGDCFLIAPTGAVAAHAPAQLKKLFREHPDGSVDLTFYGHGTVRVPKLTDAEIVLGSRAGAQGVWLNVVEKALGEVLLAKAHARGKRGKETDLDAVNHGGSEAETVRLLTGRQVVSVTLRKAKGKDAVGLEQKVHAILTSAHSAGSIMAAGIDGAPVPHGLASDHAYAVLGYDPSSRLVDVWNPWGAGYNSHPQNGARPGPETGYVVKDGRFSVPLREFVRVFDSFQFETNAAAPRK